jgi:hypothetical protein
MLTKPQEINDMMLNRFSDPATLIAIGPNRVALFLEKFPDESKARNLVVPIPESHDPAVLENLAFALAKHSIRDRLQNTMLAIETVALPENEGFLIEVIRRRFPCVSFDSFCALNKALEIWFSAREELGLFALNNASSLSFGPNVGRVTPACPLIASGGGGCAPLPAQDSTENGTPKIDEHAESKPPTLHAPRSTTKTSPSPRYPDTPVPLNHAQRSTTPTYPALDELLHKLTNEFRRLVVLPKYAAETLALYTVHTYAFQLRDVSVYLGIESPEKGCGKTTLLTVLDLLVHNPVVASNISPSAFFRVIEEMQPTLLIDEADTFLNGNDDLRGILNAGYRRKTAFVIRVSNLPRPKPAKTEQSESNAPDAPRPVLRSALAKEDPRSIAAIPGSPTPLHPVSDDSRSDARTLQRSTTLSRFSCWCPKAIATIGHLPETLADRCITIRIQKKTAEEQCDRIKTLDPAELVAACYNVVETHTQEIADAKPVMPAALSDRASDIWEPLIALADIAGGDWPQLAREAALALSATAQETSPVGSLLATVLGIFKVKETARMFSRDLVLILNQFLKSPWAELTKGKPATELWLARVLRPYGIRPSNIWIEGEQFRGYYQADFIDLNARYVAPSRSIPTPPPDPTQSGPT